MDEKSLSYSDVIFYLTVLAYYFRCFPPHGLKLIQSCCPDPLVYELLQKQIDTPETEAEREKRISQLGNIFRDRKAGEPWLN